MKRFFPLIGSASLLGIFASCGDLGPDSEAAQEEQLHHSTSIPGVPPADSLGNPGESPAPRVPGE